MNKPNLYVKLKDRETQINAGAITSTEAEEYIRLLELKNLIAIGMTVGERYSNTGQIQIDRIGELFELLNVTL